MGYTTDFEGEFELNKKLDDETFKLLKGLNKTRRMARTGLDKKYGIEGEFYIPEDGNCGQSDMTGVPEHGQNTPPKTQPGLWCQWTPERGEGKDPDVIKWDGGEKFYEYVAWIKYIIERILKPRGYTLTGSVMWQGEEMGDRGRITIRKNKVTVKDLE